MDKGNPSLAKVLKMIENNEISPSEGMALINKFNNSKDYTGTLTDTNEAGTNVLPAQSYKVGAEMAEANSDKDLLRDKAEQFLKNLIANVTKLPAESILPNLPFENYGIDSMMILSLDIASLLL